MRRSEAQRAAAARLAEGGVAEPAREARLLLRFASGLDGAALVAAGDAEMEAGERARFDAALATRLAGAPLSHATGERLFWGRAFGVTPDVLDPRPETEVLVAWALETPAPRRVLDLGVGSGCILLTILAERPEATGLGIDASGAALAVAATNAARLGVAGRVAFARADWLDGIAERFDLVVANPPYLDGDDMAALPPSLRAEPAAALDGGSDGLDAYRRILGRLDAVLAPGGRTFLEIGSTQAAAVSGLARAAGWPEPSLRRDLDGRPRVLGLARP